MHQVQTPRTLSGIKSYARLLKTEQGIPHHAALDSAAREAGFQNWNHAHKVLGQPKTQTPHWCQIATVWRDWETKTAGWEMLWIPIARPLMEMVRQERLLSAGYAGAYRLVGKNHLVDRSGAVRHRSTAQWFAERTARTLLFMQATGFRPTRSRRTPGHPSEVQGRGIPGGDHFSGWYDPATRNRLGLDEPYGHRRTPERTQWADLYNFRLSDPNWGGLHTSSGGGTEPTLIVPAAYDIGALGKKLELLDGQTTTWRSWSDPCKFWWSSAA